MSTATIEQRRPAELSATLAAWSAIAGGAMTLFLGFPLASYQSQDPVPWWIAALNAFSHLLLLGGVVGLARTRAAGWGRAAVAGWGLTLIGLLVLTVAEPVNVINPDVAIPLYSIATLGMLVGLLLTGVAVLRRGRWSGWHRSVPLACGLYILLVLAPSFALPDPASNYAIGLWGACWMLLGWSQRAESRL